MRIIPYDRDQFPALAAMARQICGACTLGHRPFVDHYYTGQPFCTLYLAYDDSGQVIGSLGVERARFRYHSAPLELAFGSNFHARTSGVGGFLFRRWMKSCTYGIAIGGSEDSHRIFRDLRWTYFSGLGLYYLDRSFAPGPGAPLWERAARLAARQLWRAGQLRIHAISRRGRIARHIRDTLSIAEENAFSADLLPARSPFVFRFTPTLDHLAWRYATDLSFVRYRLFRIQLFGETIGYAILNDAPHRITVAHCDGSSAEMLAYGILLCVLAVLRGKRREVRLLSCHPDMDRVYERFGFRRTGRAPPVVIGSLGRPVDIDPDTSGWMIHYDWGDNGLRRPFLDQCSDPATEF